MICRHCFNDNPEGVEVCVFCGNSMLITVEEQTVGTVYCTQCGEANREDALFCLSCRRLLGEVPEALQDLRPPPATETAAKGFPPKDLMDLINETFIVYRGHLAAFLAIAVLSQAIALVTVVVSGVAVEVGVAVALVALAALGWGASVEAVAQHYLEGRVRLIVCYRRALQRWPSLAVAFLALSVVTWIGPYMLRLANWDTYYGLALLPIACFALVRWFFFTGPVMIEGKPHLSSLTRSHQLVGRNGWRVFGIGVAFTLVYIGASLMLSIPGIVIGPYSNMLGDLLLIVAAMVTLPILWIGATLVYFHLRQTSDGFDLARLASDLGYEAHREAGR